jgi:hypothetical protein
MAAMRTVLPSCSLLLRIIADIAGCRCFYLQLLPLRVAEKSGAFAPMQRDVGLFHRPTSGSAATSALSVGSSPCSDSPVGLMKGPLPMTHLYLR